MSQDPRQIILNFTTPGGVWNVTFEELDHWLYRQCQGSIVMGVRIGAGAMLMIALYLLCDKRDAPKKLFYLANEAALFFMVMKSVLYLYYYLGASGSITTEFSGYYVLGASNRNMTTATNVFQVLQVAAIEFVLFLQVHTMYKDFQEDVFRYVRLAVQFACVLLSLATIALYIVDIVYALIDTYAETARYTSGWRVNVPIILFLSSVWFSSFFLIMKFVYCYWKRRVSGIKNYSYGHSIFIMAFQTMLIPALVNVATYGSNMWTSNLLPEVAFFLTTIFLPLSSMWAGSKADTTNPYSDFGYILTSNRDSSVISSYITDDHNSHDVISNSSRGYQYKEFDVVKDSSLDV